MRISSLRQICAARRAETQSHVKDLSGLSCTIVLQRNNHVGFRQRRVIDNRIPLPTDDVLACPEEVKQVKLDCQRELAACCLLQLVTGRCDQFSHTHACNLQGKPRLVSNPAFHTKQARARLRVVHILVRCAQEKHLINKAVCRHDAALFVLNCSAC